MSLLKTTTHSSVIFPISSKASRLTALWSDFAIPTSSEQLLKVIKNLEEQIKAMQVENEMYTDSLIRLDPSLLDGVQQAIDYAFRLQNAASVTFASRSSARLGGESLLFIGSTRTLGSFSRSRNMSSRKFQSASILNVLSGHGTKVNVQEKIELVDKAMDVLVSKLNWVKKKADRSNELLTAQFEELANRKVLIDGLCNNYVDEVLVKGVDPLVRRIPGEVWLRHMRSSTKKLDKNLGKLRLRLSTLNSKLFRTKYAIEKKAEISEQLRPVDFEKVEILNSEFKKKIELKTEQLCEVKLMSGDAHLALTVHRKCMGIQDDFLTDVGKLTKKKYQNIKNLKKEAEFIQKLVDSSKKEVAKLLSLIRKYEKPDTFGYLHLKIDHFDLSKQLMQLTRREKSLSATETSDIPFYCKCT